MEHKAINQVNQAKYADSLSALGTIAFSSGIA
jgi:hypothetical protein